MNNSVKFVVLIFFAAMLLAGLMLIHPFGLLENSDVDDYYIQNGQAELGANNIVTTIVFDYRGFDTLGEATVLFGAAVGVLTLFRGVGR